MRSSYLVSLLGALATSTHAASISQQRRQEIDADNCCQALLQKLGGAKVLFPGSSSFQNLVTSYYTQQESSLISQCRVAAQSAQDVADTVKIVSQGQCQFSVRSVGHMTWAGAANIASPGVAIDLKAINSVSVSDDKKVASIGPGAAWGPVYDQLDPHGVTVVGGRSNTVGVGGFTLGGGFSNLSPEHGFASDNVVNYEVVLADGTIANVNLTSNADLYWGLKAGSTNLGVITRYDLKAYPLTPKWGGVRGYNVSQGAELFDAMGKTIVKLRKEPLGGGSVVWGYNEQLGNDTIFGSYAYVGADGTKTDLFSEMLAVPFQPGTDSTRANTNQQSLDEEVDVAYPHGLRRIFATLTLKVDSQIAVGIYEKSHELFAPFVGKPEVEWTASFQPISITHLEATAHNGAGGTPQGLSPSDGDLILLNLNTVWAEESDDEGMEKAVRGVIDWATEEAKRRDVFHPWLYINYALPDQKVYDSYGADNVSRLREIKNKYDPSNVFGRLWKGGFKF